MRSKVTRGRFCVGSSKNRSIRSWMILRIGWVACPLLYTPFIPLSMCVCLLGTDDSASVSCFVFDVRAALELARCLVTDCIVCINYGWSVPVMPLETLLWNICLHFQIRADHTSYYHDALHFLGCTDLAELSCEWIWSVISRRQYNFMLHNYASVRMRKQGIIW